VEQNITMQGGTINWGGSVEDRIHQIVREEVNKEGVGGTTNQFITDQGIYTGRIISEVRHA